MDALRSRRPRRRRSPGLEALEVRDVPATFGIPWADPGHLSISFAPDGTSIAGDSSSLSATLGAHLTTSTWQGEVLRAFQTWAAGAGINLTVVPDDGSPFGTPGLSQHDPRFGDIRIGAHPMASDALAISVPNDPTMTGTWTGDLLFNSTETYDAAHLDLFTVALHEAGHVFGLSESTDARSPMFASYSGNKTLTSADLKDIQVLYGNRPADAQEGSSGNATIAKAATLQAPGSYDGATPLVVFGDVAAGGDVDTYALSPPLSKYQGGATIRLQTAGVSLLAPRLTVLDAKGNVLGESQSGGSFGSTVSVHLDRVVLNAKYYLRVQAATADSFGFGHYGLAVTFDQASTTPASTLDAVLRGDRQSFGPNEIAALFRTSSSTLFNDDRHSDDAIGAAVVLAPDANFAKETHYQAVGSLSDAADVDFYRVKVSHSGNGQPNILTVRLRAVTPNGMLPRATIVDSDGNPVASTILANGNSQFTIQAVGIKGSGNLFIRVAGASGTAVAGNYALTADFGGVATVPTTFASGVVSPASPTPSTDLYVARTQLFQFRLATTTTDGTAPPAGTGVRLTILDASGRAVFRLFSAAGDVASGPAVLLTPGAYTVRFSAEGPPGVAIPSLSFRLDGGTISDPIGPAIQNPTLQPIYTAPNQPGMYLYPTAAITTVPFWFGTIRR